MTNEIEDSIIDRIYLNQLIKLLSPRQRVVLKLRYGLIGDPHGLTYKELGSLLGVTSTRIRQIEVMALRWAKTYSRRPWLADPKYRPQYH